MGKLSSVGSSFMAAAGSRSTSGGFDEGAKYFDGQILEAPNLHTFTFIELKTATKNFRPDSVLGEGGFERVYKGWVDEKTMAPTRNGTGMVVAVKKLNSESMQGFEEWQVNKILLLFSLLYNIVLPERGLPVTRVISRMTLQQILARAVGYDAILNGSHVVNFRDDGSKVTAILEDDRIFELPYWRTVEYLKVRKTLFGHSDATYSGYTCYIGIADFVPPNIDTACLKLIERFREREENVKPSLVAEARGPKVVKSINRQLCEKSIKTKVGTFSELKELVVVLLDCLADHFGSLVPGIEKALNVSYFKDTFLDANHVQQSFPDYQVTFINSDGTKNLHPSPPFKIRLSKKMRESSHALPGNMNSNLTIKSRNNMADGEPQKEKLIVETYIPADPGPYPQDKPKQNSVRFTPTQIGAIISGIQPGLTMVVGPPGTGKTDTVVQILNVLYHNCPSQRTLIITHSNHNAGDVRGCKPSGD
ncbi:Zeaxanthin epoxidase, chloroplastic [Zea mays]|uniref:Zeaxanthin epoxidase, chloroplastic n=1 Tax=Zea mays TaxID=4577 RepID=A0A3L6DC36_MAIZE|nr:Zeaxanthin epoxidase, chloroplastic [Zea mays]